MKTTNDVDHFRHRPALKAPHRNNLRFSVLTDDTCMEQIIELARIAHEESRFGYIAFNPDKAEVIIRKSIIDPKRNAFMLARRGDDLPPEISLVLM